MIGAEKLPKVPSDELTAIMVKHLEKVQAIVYTIGWWVDPITEIKEKSCKCTCTACGKTFWADYVNAGGCGHSGAAAPYGVRWGGEEMIHGQDALCPECGAEAKLIWAGGIRGTRELTSYGGVEYAQVEGKAAILAWDFCAEVNKDGRRTILRRAIEAYVLDEGKITRYAGRTRFMGCGGYQWHEWKQRQKYSDEMGSGTVDYIPERVFAGTEAENARMEAMGAVNTFPVSYLRYWTKCRGLETLAQEVPELLGDCINRNAKEEYCGYTPILFMPAALPKQIRNKKAKRPCDLLGLSPEEFRWCRDDRWSADVLALFQRAKADGIRWKREDVQSIMILGSKDTERLYEKVGAETIRVVRYIMKQIVKKSVGKGDPMTTYMDYLNMLDQLEDRDPARRYPRSLVSAHDTAAKAVNAMKDRKSDAGIAETARKHAALIWEHDGIIIRPAMTTQELRDEGKALSHCVASYAQKVAEGKACIFFIRRADEPEKSWYTLEFLPSGKVQQNRGKHNCARTEEVIAFQEAWEARIKAEYHKNENGVWVANGNHSETGAGDRRDHSGDPGTDETGGVNGAQLCHGDRTAAE